MELILGHLSANGSISVVQLMEILDVSRETIRRDLIRMSELGIIKKVRGGAILTRVSEEPPYSLRIKERYDEKRAIGSTAASLVEAGDTIFIDTGTTTLAFAQMLTQQGVRVVTNSIPIASLLCQRDFEVYLTGGKVRKDELSASGFFANHLVENIQVDKAFCGTSGVDVQYGIVDYHLEEAELRKKIMDRAGQVIVLADHTKFRSSAFVTVCPMASVDIIVTDARVPSDLLADLENLDVQVMVASSSL